MLMNKNEQKHFDTFTYFVILTIGQKKAKISKSS